jgi:hypothetical protein
MSTKSMLSVDPCSSLLPSIVIIYKSWVLHVLSLLVQSTTIRSGKWQLRSKIFWFWKKSNFKRCFIKLDGENHWKMWNVLEMKKVLIIWQSSSHHTEQTQRKSLQAVNCRIITLHVKRYVPNVLRVVEFHSLFHQVT